MCSHVACSGIIRNSYIIRIWNDRFSCVLIIASSDLFIITFKSRRVHPDAPVQFNNEINELFVNCATKRINSTTEVISSRINVLGIIVISLNLTYLWATHSFLVMRTPFTTVHTSFVCTFTDTDWWLHNLKLCTFIHFNHWFNKMKVWHKPD